MDGKVSVLRSSIRSYNFKCRLSAIQSANCFILNKSCIVGITIYRIRNNSKYSKD
jgi:hypothetical protein